ncbi:MAG: TetR family transcriptional regulator [Marmoricola sp.]|nr:TetR family transcriptional regulator [Marmoricola sp.]
MRSVPAQIAIKLHQALPLIADQGLEQTKIDEIADATGVPKATLYYYFSGKEEILAFLFEDMLTAIADEAKVAMEIEGTSADRLTAVVGVQIRRLVENRDLSAALVGDLGRVTRSRALVESLQAAFYSPIESLLIEGAADGSLRDTGNPILGSMAVIGPIIISVLMTAIVPPEAAEPDDDVAGDLIAIILSGLLPRG